MNSNVDTYIIFNDGLEDPEYRQCRLAVLHKFDLYQDGDVYTAVLNKVEITFIARFVLYPFSCLSNDEVPSELGDIYSSKL